MENRKHPNQERVFSLLIFIMILIGCIPIFTYAFYNLFLSEKPICDVSRPILEQSIDVEILWTGCPAISILPYYRAMLIADDNLIIQDYQRDALISFDLSSGRLEWSTLMEGSSNTILDSSQEQIYISNIHGSLREMYRIDANTGDVIWYNGEQNGTRERYTPIFIADNQLIAISSFQSVRELDINTGELGEILNIGEGSFYSTNYLWQWQYHRSNLTAVDVNTGNIFWQTDALHTYSYHIQDIQLDNKVVVVDTGLDLIAFSLESGDLLWTTSEINLVGFSILTSGRLYVLDLSARLHIIDAISGSEYGYIQFEPPEAGHDNHLFGGESISSSQIIANQNVIAIYFGDTDKLTVYQVE